MADQNLHIPDGVNPAALNPIVYVRGYAMTRGEIDATTADPFCGFNIGSTVYRAKPDRNEAPRKYIFESPVVRLAKDFGYQDVFSEGEDFVERQRSDRWIPQQSIIIFRYYDEASRLLGHGETPPITKFASDLSLLIRDLRDRVVLRDGQTPALKIPCRITIG